jgi:hypothetical protein
MALAGTLTCSWVGLKAVTGALSVPNFTVEFDVKPLPVMVNVKP